MRCPCYGDPCEPCGGTVEEYIQPATRQGCWRFIMEGHGLIVARQWVDYVKRMVW